MSRTALLLSALLLLTALPAFAGDEAPAEDRAYPENMLVETLDNGLQVVIEERHSVPIVRVHAYMKIGSLYEGEYLGSGLSHYMEHIVSGGSTRRKVVDANGSGTWVGRTEDENKSLLKSIGGNSNASTYYNFTQYYITTKSEMAETAMDLISDYLANCQFDAGEVAREQRVVQQELLRNQDDANRERSLLFSSTMFKVHPVSVPVIGYQSCIQDITREDMLRFYKKHYTPQNCVVSIVGDIDRFEVLEQVKAHFGTWKRKSLEPYTIPEEPEQTAMRWVEKEHGSTQTCLVAMGVPTIPLMHPDLYKLDMLAFVLGLGAGSRLPTKFEHDASREVIATGIGAGSLTPVYGAGRLACYFGTDTIDHARGLVWEIWGEMNRLKEELVSEAEIARALKVYEKYYYMGRATVDDRAENLASSLAWLNDPVYGDQYMERIREVTPEQVREAARKYLVGEKLNVVIVKPPAPEAARASREIGEGEGKVRKVVMDNGLTLLLKRIPDYGMVDVAAAFNGGVIYETEETNGLFFLIGNTFWRGSENRPWGQLMGDLDRLGMDLESESHNNIYNYKMHCLASDLEGAFDVYTDLLLHPAFEPQIFDHVKMLVQTRVLPNLGVDANEMMQKTIRNTLYEQSPYRMQRYGTPESVASFTVEQARAVYETFTRPNNCVLAIYGDIDLDATQAMVEETLGGWERGEVPAAFVVEEPPLAKPVDVELTNNQVRTNYRKAWRGFSRQRADVDKWASSVMNTIMGAQGWLHARLREGDADYVYSVYCQPYNGDKAGHFFIDTDFSPGDEEAVLGIIDGVVADMQAGKFTDAELDLAKTMILCYSALGKKENPPIVAGDALSELFGQGYDYDEKFYAGIQAVTREDVIRVANEIFSTPALRVFVRPANGESKTKPAAAGS
jgi:zinc protease